MIEKNGVIISSFGGNFKVAAEDEEYICKARGSFRNKDIVPICGDNVKFIIENNSDAVITEIFERRNEIIRPPLANLDQLVFVISTCEPAPNILLLDKFLSVSVFKNISPVIVFTKTDKHPADEYVKIYENIFPTVCVDNVTGEGVGEVYKLLSGKLSAFTGNSGAGKSTLLNNICPDLSLETNEISRKLGRGKHTTRRVEIFRLENGGYVADTPGFSTFNTQMYDRILKDELAYCFPEFEEHIGSCRFQDCSHTKEQGCKVIEAVNNGSISRSRHASYCEMYREASLIKPWEIKNSTKR